jgi:putative acyl-CoA dehydrogenase
MLAELERARGADLRLDAWLIRLKNCLREQAESPAEARRVVEHLALALQAGLLVQHAPPAVADAFCASRLADGGGRQFGTLPRGLDLALICTRARPLVG